MVFLNISPDNYRITSRETPIYNSIAWAVGENRENNRWWSPDPFENYYWPPSVPREETLDAYTQLFNLFGYLPYTGDDATLESGFEKIAIYVNSAGVPIHVAKQRRSGEWTSKLGKGPDIVHDTLAAIEGQLYGSVGRVLIRPATA